MDDSFAKAKNCEKVPYVVYLFIIYKEFRYQLRQATDGWMTVRNVNKSIEAKFNFSSFRIFVEKNLIGCFLTT